MLAPPDLKTYTAVLLAVSRRICSCVVWIVVLTIFDTAVAVGCHRYADTAAHQQYRRVIRYSSTYEALELYRAKSASHTE